ncbi:hypothetical protein ROZALSC1DRAFT_29121, partial [Rozella allomycis CSF55]
MTEHQKNEFQNWLNKEEQEDLKELFEQKIKDDDGELIPFSQYCLWDKDTWKDMLNDIATAGTVFGRLHEIKKASSAQVVMDVDFKPAILPSEHQKNEFQNWLNKDEQEDLKELFEQKMEDDDGELIPFGQYYLWKEPKWIQKL